MDLSNIQIFIDSIIYDFGTLEILLAHDRIKETVPVMERIFNQIRLLNENIPCDELKDLFADTSWQEDFHYLISQKDFSKAQYARLIQDTRRWVYGKIYQLRQRTKSSQQKQFETIIFILCGCIAGFSVLLIFILSFCFHDWGLRGDFYKGRNFGKHICGINNKMINFNNYLEMNPRVPAEDFSARWKGYVLVPHDGQYIFSLLMDDGARLSIDNTCIIDQWKDHTTKEFEKKIFLTKGPHAILLEYYNHLNDAILKLYWSKDGHNKEIIPAWNFRR